jgi:deoxyguanosine kinase
MQQNHWKYQYIAIEGNIGAGKTTLCKRLGAELNCKLILETFADNPFLSQFYENPERHGFSVELFFMTDRYKQLQEHLVTTLFHQNIIADFFFIKTLLFAKQNLKPDEYRLFKNIFDILNGTFPKPELLVYLHRPTEQLVKNIRKRGRTYEQQIPVEYLESIQTAYFDYFRTEREIPILIIDIDDMDFIKDQNYYHHLTELINRDYKLGMNYVSISK